MKRIYFIGLVTLTGSLIGMDRVQDEQVVILQEKLRKCEEQLLVYAQLPVVVETLRLQIKELTSQIRALHVSLNLLGENSSQSQPVETLKKLIEIAEQCYWVEHNYKEAFANFRIVERQDDPDLSALASVWLAKLFLEGRGVSRNYQYAWVCLEGASQGTSKAACARARVVHGFIHHRGCGVKQDTNKAKQWYLEAWIQNDDALAKAAAAVGLGVLNYEMHNYSEAIRYFDFAAQQPYKECRLAAACWLGTLYYSVGRFDEASKCFESVAQEDGSIDQPYVWRMLGQIYYLHHKKKPSALAAALLYFKKAAQQQQDKESASWGYAWWGDALVKGRGIPKNLVEARTCFEKSIQCSENGAWGFSNLRLGQLLLATDLPAAVSYLRKAEVQKDCIWAAGQASALMHETRMRDSHHENKCQVSEFLYC